jgi:phage terminase large subunit
MELNLKASNVFRRNRNAPSRIVVNQGGTGSSKTFSILQLLLVRALSEPLHISICSLSLPHLKRGALRDWLIILNTAGIYRESAHNKTENIFKIGQSHVEFFSLDMPGKARGPRRDILYINEANLIPLETYRQLETRTKKNIYIDYNPADEFHWIYDQLLDGTRTDVTFIRSTYLDNPFLSPGERFAIEQYKYTDENYWRVYGLGERGSSRATIYTHWQLIDKLPEGGEELWGVDFGYNHPAAIVQVKILDNDIYARERFHQTGAHNSDLIAALRQMGVTSYANIYADSARPEYIQEIYDAGFNCQKSDKDVQKGIDSIRSRKLFITSDSPNLIKEIKSYKYKEDSSGNVLEDPVKLNDDLCDGLRYAVHTYLNNPGYGKYGVG